MFFTPQRFDTAKTHRRPRLPETLRCSIGLHRHTSTAILVFSALPRRRASTMLSDRYGNALTASSVGARRLRRRSRPTPVGERRC